MIDLSKEGTKAFERAVQLLLAAIVFLVAMTVTPSCSSGPTHVDSVDTRRAGWVQSIDGPCVVSTPRPNHIVVDCP